MVFQVERIVRFASSTAIEGDQIMKTTAHDAQNIIFPLLSGIGILANAFVIAVISIWEKCQKNRTVTNSFVVNLAIADLLFLLTLPLHMPVIFDNDGWVYGAAMCKIIEAIKYINFRASILFLTMMSVDRYLGIVFSMRSREYRTRRNAIKTCFALWLLSCVAAIPVLLFAKVDPFRKTCELQFPGYQSNFASASELETFVASLYSSDESSGIDNDVTYSLYSGLSALVGDNSTGPENAGNLSEIARTEDYFCMNTELQHSAWYIGWEYSNFALFFALPIICIIFCYCAIIRAVLTRHVRSNANKQGQHNVARMVAVLVGVFILSWGPFQTWRLLTLPPGQQVPHTDSCLVIETTVTMLAWSNSAINPILYSISSKRFWEKTKAAWLYVKYGQRSFMAYQTNNQTARTRITTQCNVGNVHRCEVMSPTSTATHFNPYFSDDRRHQSTDM